MTTISFTEYVLPNGSKRSWVYPLDDELKPAVDKIMKAGGYFEAEILTTGQVSFTVEREDDNGKTELLSIVLSENGPVIKKAISKLVRMAEAALEREDSLGN